MRTGNSTEGKRDQSRGSRSGVELRDNPSKSWPAIVAKPRAMKRLIQQTPEIPDLEERIAAGRELGKRFTESSGRAHRHLYDALQFCAQTYIRIAYDDGLKAVFFNICVNNGIKRTAASKPLAMLLKLMLSVDNKAASGYALAIGYALNRKISPRRIASFFRKRAGGVEGCIAKARKAREERDGKLVAARVAIKPPITKWTTAAREDLKAGADLKKIVMFATVEDDGALRITRVLKPRRAMHKLQTHLALGPSSHRRAA
jgi:hypothetical protein